eukprot:766059-Hanusia_phi.AAC.1
MKLRAAQAEMMGVGVARSTKRRGYVRVCGSSASGDRQRRPCSGDYVGTLSNGADDKLTTDGVIYPSYSSGAQVAGSSQLTLVDDGKTALYELPDNSADYVGTPPEPLTGDGVIYPAYDPSYSAVPNDSNTA